MLPPPPPPPAAVAVVIPARDEAPRIGACLRGVVAALGRVHGPEVLVVVVDDGSSDGTGALAAAVLSASGTPHVVVRAAAGSAGAARAVGVRTATAHLEVPAHLTWVLSTDADTVVPGDWVQRYLAHAAMGATAVAGVVALLEDVDARRVRDVWWADYGPTLAPDGSHPHVHAANMGIRLDVLAAAGGIPGVDHEEDRVLWDRLRAIGETPIADAGLVVATSARLHARVPRGFAHALGQLDRGRG